jgi:hypothetical protein
LRIDGEERELDEPFSIGLQYPAEPDAPASEVVNCGCFLDIIYRSGDKKDLTNPVDGGIINLPDIQIGRSLGARAKNYDIFDNATGNIYKFVEGTKIQNAEVFAGKGTRNPLKREVAEGLSKTYGGEPQNWQHAKGIGIVDYEGEHLKAEIHWFSNPEVGKEKFTIKRWLE